jgi:hypothetical protein
VTGGELSVHLRGDAMVAVHAKTVPDLSGVSIDPTFPSAEAEELALAFSARRTEADPAAGPPRLELLNRGLFEGRVAETRLAWFVEVRASDVRDFVWIDAQTGALLLAIDQLTHALDREVYDAGNTTVRPGTLERSEGEAPTGDAEVDDAYEFVGSAYDYFSAVHARDSYDGNGATIVASIRACYAGLPCPAPNASWDGTQLAFGDGFPAADDVVAHELTHAVTEHTAHLYYYMQSGALNESYSDIFGETIDLLNGAGDDSAGVRWELGEDLPGGPTRDLMDPTAFGHPGKMSDAEFFCGDSLFADGGGVHVNSGVPNHAFALMVDGGTYNSIVVTGLGLSRAGAIQYRALNHYLLSASDFEDNANALEQACADLVGTLGISLSDCGGVADALGAVEMADPWGCTTPNPQAVAPDYCAPLDAPVILAGIDFEAPTGLPACPTNGVVAAWCHAGPESTLGSHATSGSHSAWAYNPATTAQLPVALSTTFDLPAGALLQFDHSYGFENVGGSYFDGGLLQYSLNAGGTWFDAGGLIAAGAAYEGSIAVSGGTNPNAGAPAFVGDSWGYTASQLDLSSLAGENVWFRWIVSTDIILGDLGWYLDDILVYVCEACATSHELDGLYNGTASVYTAAVSITAGDGFTVGPIEAVTFEAGSFVALANDLSVRGDLIVNLAGACP